MDKLQPSPANVYKQAVKKYEDSKQQLERAEKDKNLALEDLI